MVRGSWAPCKRPECPCAASWNGAYGEYCCVECRDGTPCTSNRHKIPPTPSCEIKGTTMTLYHGTTRDRYESIRANGFWPSKAEELLGAGVYFVEHADIEKAKRFAHDVGKRFGEGDEALEPVLLKCEVVVDPGKLKVVNGDCRDWEAEGYKACRASKTSMSKTPEWCVSPLSSIEIKEVVSLKGSFKCPPGHSLTAFETPQPDFLCNLCYKKQARGAWMLGCRTCDYDVCRKCSRKISPCPFKNHPQGCWANKRKKKCPCEC